MEDKISITFAVVKGKEDKLTTYKSTINRDGKINHMVSIRVIIHQYLETHKSYLYVILGKYNQNSLLRKQVYMISHL